MARAEIIAGIIGGIAGLIISGYAFFYAPMKANYERNGCIWLECGEGE